MRQKFVEIVLEGRFMMVKGFLLGFLSCTKPDGKYFFHRKSNIRRDTFKEMLKEFFELDNYAHFCLQADLVDNFKKSTKLFTKVTGNKIKSIRTISSANFTFALEVYSEQFGKEAKQLFEVLPPDVNIIDYEPVEKRDKEGKGTEAYAPLHEYVFRAKGKVEGDFGGVMDLYLNIKRSDFSEFVICSEIQLTLE